MCEPQNILQKVHNNVLESFPPGLDLLATEVDPFYGGGESGGSAPAQAAPPAPTPPTSTRTAADATSFERPEALALPTFLGINSGMSPGQQLSRIATLGTQGSFGDIRSPSEGPYAGQGASDVARSYFKNLALRTFTNQSGSPMNNPELLPVYEQYLSQSLGQPAIEGRDSLAHFLTRLTRV